MISEFHADRANLEQEWQEGGDGPALLKGYSTLADSFIVSCFDEISVPDKQANIALVAIGGYGRSELFPRSDIDLMILYRSDCDEVKTVACPMMKGQARTSHHQKQANENMWL